MTLFDPLPDTNTAASSTPADQPLIDQAPPVGMTPPTLLAREAAEGRRGAAWRLLHGIMANDPEAVTSVAALDDDRLAHHLLEFIALGTWAGKPFVLPGPLRSAYARTSLRTLFLPGSGMPSGRAEHVLQAAAHDARPAMRENAIHILGLIGDITTTPTLIEALNDSTQSVRLQAAKALGRVGNPAAVPALLRTLRDADEQLGSQIFSTLVHLGSPAVPALIRESTSGSAWIRWHCVRALGEICDYRALPVLVRALHDSDHSVAWMAAKSLARYGKMCLKPVLHVLIDTEMTPWLVETASYVLHDLYVRDAKLKPYLLPVIQSMHGVAYRIATPQAAGKALNALDEAGL
ncbi:hypothetical protein EPA93_42425 [Ktedonosporobacter rubrisoli]|uniref:HEAT repeat domain-containing protein n=1 Tax=Ktedonosporobacter rubrisoli TaxID=2509675 RepID=A0A4P6K318_KTERU|nr:HEAT repeat domain-containing protein [Ktedonosporobacter rubrisoli]QBD82283.1 hypothetical protein EPA93_42425 [Ktedonosporobacter rubrisoli]